MPLFSIASYRCEGTNYYTNLKGSRLLFNMYVTGLMLVYPKIIVFHQERDLVRAGNYIRNN